MKKILLKNTIIIIAIFLLFITVFTPKSFAEKGMQEIDGGGTTSSTKLTPRKYNRKNRR